jgi:diguanylate cyclase (GGDEF)-like protein
MDPRFLRRSGHEPARHTAPFPFPAPRRGEAAAWRSGAAVIALACAAALLPASRALAIDATAGDVAQAPAAPRPAASSARIPDIALPAQVAVPRFTIHSELERLQVLGRSDPDRAAGELERFVAAHPAPDPQRLEALISLGMQYASLSQPDDLERVARLLDALVDSQPLARPAAMITRANGLWRHNELTRADRLLIESSALISPDAPLALRLAWLSTSGSVKTHSGHYDEALRRRHDAITLVDRNGGPAWRAIDTRLSLANTLIDAGQPEKVFEIHDEVRRRAEEVGDEESLATIANERAILLSNEGSDPAATLAAWQSAIEHSRRAGDRRGLVLNLADLADHYLRHDDFQTALEISRLALPLARELHDESTQSVALGNIGLALIAMHRKDEGMVWLRDAAALDEHNASMSDLAANTLEMGGYLERAGYTADALAAYRQYRQQEADAGVQDQQHAVLELQESFANDQRQHELDMLSREGKLKDEEIRHHDLELKEWTAAGIASLLMAGVLATLARRLRLRNQQLSVSNEALRIQAERDPLTGLANRHYLQTVMAGRNPARGLEGTLYLLDVDHFKHINDRCGHAGGDTVLIEIAHRLRETLREDDLIVRWGGEEFLVLVKPMPMAESEALAQRLLASLAERPVMFEGQPVPVSASIGYGQFPLPGAEVPVDWERAISLVDTAMYLSKAHGRNCACGIRRVDPSSAAQLDVLAQTLETAWREGRADLHLQHGPELGQPTAPASRDGRARGNTEAAEREAVQ